MGPYPRPALCFAMFSVAACVLSPVASASGADPVRALVGRIAATTRPDSTAVLVVSDRAVLEDLFALSARAIAVLPIALPNTSPTPPQIGQMFRETSAATITCASVWVVVSVADQRTSRRAAMVAEMAAKMSRTRVLRDSIKTNRGTVMFSHWVDMPGGMAQRLETHRALAIADSILAHGGPTRIPITRPFTRSELAVDPDSVSRYVALLADTSFYSIGGCSEVELVTWDASEKLAQMGPGVVPILIERIADPDLFVRERVQDALMSATQDERILARTGGEYLKFYDQPDRPPHDIVEAWWAKFQHFWTPADSTH